MTKIDCETFIRGGCTWEVVKRYRLTREYMKKYELVYENRITVKCILSNGVIPVGFIMDYADTEVQDA